MLPLTLRDMAGDNGVARSLFLSALMITSVMTGILFFGIEEEGANGSPSIDSDVPDTILIGEIETVNISISDEEMGSLSVLITLNGELVTQTPNSEGVVTLDISSLEVGSHALQVIATDSLGQETTWAKAFIIHYPEESEAQLTISQSAFEIEQGGSAPISGHVIHDDISTCGLRWSTADIEESSLGLPIGEDGTYGLELSNIQENTIVSLEVTCGTWVETSNKKTISITIMLPEPEPVTGCTDPDANNYDSGADEDDGSCDYDEPSRLKILSLHGGGESSSAFESQQGMQDLMGALPEFEFVFVQSPEDGSVWVRDPPGGKEQGTNDPSWADRSIDFLDEFVHNNGPFYGLLGFSQGAAMSAIYLAYSDVQFDKVILFNGYLETGHRGLNDTIESESPFDVPALVFEGENDAWFGYGSAELAELFSNVTHLVGSADHNLPLSSDREFENVVSFIRDVRQYGCTDPDASNFNNEATLDDGSCNYDNQLETGSLEWWREVLLCDSTEQIEPVDDYNTTESDNHLCQLSFEIGETEIIIDSNGIPNHDLESGPGCCTTEQTLEWRIPIVPNNQTGCDPTLSTDGCTMAPERDAVALAVNGVPIFGPEDGPGGDAVAGHEGEYEEDRQHIWLGICHGHSGPGGAYHYHADANCAHWHPDEETNQTWRDYSIDSSRSLSEHSPIVGFAFDGYPIYGFIGWNEEGNVSEMKSSYRLKEGETGYNGIDDYEYIVGLGDLDSCNGQFGPTPDYPEGIYHYHTTWQNGEGDLGFPYFINCYRGEVSLVNQNEEGDGEVDCSGRGETWGPGIGPPPEGCEGGPSGQSSDISSAFGTLYRSVPPSGGILAMVVIAVAFVRVLAFAPVSPSQAGITALYPRARV